MLEETKSQIRYIVDLPFDLLKQEELFFLFGKKNYIYHARVLSCATLLTPFWQFLIYFNF